MKKAIITKCALSALALSASFQTNAGLTKFVKNNFLPMLMKTQKKFYSKHLDKITQLFPQIRTGGERIITQACTLGDKDQTIVIEVDQKYFEVHDFVSKENCKKGEQEGWKLSSVFKEDWCYPLLGTEENREALMIHYPYRNGEHKRSETTASILLYSDDIGIHEHKKESESEDQFIEKYVKHSIKDCKYTWVGGTKLKIGDTTYELPGDRVLWVSKKVVLALSKKGRGSYLKIIPLKKIQGQRNRKP